MMNALIALSASCLLPDRLFAPTSEAMTGFIEFFTAQISNGHTCKACLNAVRRFARFYRSVGRHLLAFISMEHAVAVAVLCVAVGGIAAQWLAWRLRLPAIVFLFAAGLLVGPGLRILAPSRALGPALQP